MKRSISTLGLVAAFAAGCAATPVPSTRFASTEAAVQSARQAGADRIPDASKHLKMAEEQLGSARSLDRGHGKPEEVDAMLIRAKSDAALAAALAQEAKQKARTGAPAPGAKEEK
jgi:hypothetical protein